MRNCFLHLTLFSSIIHFFLNKINLESVFITNGEMIILLFIIFDFFFNFCSKDLRIKFLLPQLEISLGYQILYFTHKPVSNICFKSNIYLAKIKSVSSTDK